MNRYFIPAFLLVCIALCLPQNLQAARKGTTQIKGKDIPSLTVMTSKFKLIADKVDADGNMEGITMTKFGKPEQYIEAKSARWEMEEDSGVVIVLKDVVVIHFSKSPRNTFNSIIKYESQSVSLDNNAVQLVVKIHGKGKKVRLVKGKEVLIYENKLWLLQGIVLEMDYQFLPEGHPRHYKRMAFPALVDSDSRQIMDNSWIK